MWTVVFFHFRIFVLTCAVFLFQMENYYLEKKVQHFKEVVVKSVR